MGGCGAVRWEACVCVWGRGVRSYARGGSAWELPSPRAGRMRRPSSKPACQATPHPHLEAVQRRYAHIHVPLLEQPALVAEEEGEQQRADVGAWVCVCGGGVGWGCITVCGGW